MEGEGMEFVVAGGRELWEAVSVKRKTVSHHITMAYSDFQRSRDVCSGVCVWICVWLLFISRVRNVISVEQIFCTVYMWHIKFLKIAFNLRVTNIYLSISTCMCLYKWMCAYVLVYCDEHLQLAQKVIDFGAVQSGNNGNGMEFLGKMNWNGERRFFNSAKLNRNTQMPYIYTTL